MVAKLEVYDSEGALKVALDETSHDHGSIQTMAPGSLRILSTEFAIFAARLYVLGTDRIEVAGDGTTLQPGRVTVV